MTHEELMKAIERAKKRRALKKAEPRRKSEVPEIYCQFSRGRYAEERGKRVFIEYK